jgi:Phage protein Gp138 N-terminal domain
MTQNFVSKNTLFYKPKLNDLLEYQKNNTLLDVNCHAVGIIQSFDPVHQTAIATIVYQKVFYTYVGENFQPTLVSYPALVDCPVKFLFTGAGGFTSPPQKNDECWVEFNDRDFDAWYAGQQNQAPITARLHSFTDAVIFVGIKSMPNVIQNFDAHRPAIRNFSGSCFVAVDDKIEINNGTSLETVLTKLVQDIQAITVLAGAVTPASQALLQTDIIAIKGLLK